MGEPCGDLAETDGPEKIHEMNSTTRMRALATDGYGALDRMKVVEMPVPEPGDGEVRVRVVASALNPADFKVAKGTVKFLHARNFPMVLGYDFSGTVDELGRGVDGIATGAEVFGFVPYSPTNRRGTFAEAVIARADQLAVKPAAVSHEQAAAAATPGATAIQSLRNLGRMREGMNVVVTGVSGGVGSIGVAIAKRLGGKVIAVGSGRGLELARQMGADRVVDRKKEDVAAVLRGPFDVFFDAAAAYRWSEWRGRLAPGGTFVTTLPSLAFVVDKLSSLVSGTRCAVVMVKSKPADLRLLGEWLTAGLVVPVDRTISLAEVPQHLARLEGGEVLGRVVVSIGDR
jgi:NADPH:quinone reductase-like Zn-dependent oxidoreductase